MNPRFLFSASPRLRVSQVVCALVFLSPLRAADSAALHELTYSGNQAALVELDRDIQAAGRDKTKLAALEKRLLADLARRDATFAARQAITQRLALVLSAAPDPKSAAHRTLTAMLADVRDSDLARLALQPVPGTTIDNLFVAALPKSAGAARLGLIDAVATRRISAAVSALTPLLRDRDPAIAQAAARALGEIGTAPALAALRAAPAELSAGARLAAATRLPGPEALGELRELQNNSAAPRPVRDAAFRTALDLDPASAASQIAAALASADLGRKQVALEAIAASRAPNLITTLLSRISSFDAPTQAAVLTALSRMDDRHRVDPATVPAVLGLTAHPDTQVRTAAITTLGVLPGTRDITTTLARLIAVSDAENDSRVARQSLARLNGRDVAATILAGAEQGEERLRVVYIEQLALRHMTEAIPLLLKTRADASAAVRTAAVAALGDLASPAEHRALLDWTLAATDEGEQTRALRSLVNAILREPASATRGQLLFDAIDQAKSDAALRLLPALARVGNARAAETAARLATRDDPKLAEAVTGTLSRWPDATALPALATVTEKGSTPATRNAARAGAIRYFERNRDPWTPELTNVVSRLIKASPDAADRKKLVALLHRANDRASLDLAQSLSTDQALGVAATTVADIIRANQAGRPAVRASGAPGNVGNIFDGKTSTRWNVPTEGEEWLELDFKVSRPLHTLTLDQTSRSAEFPERYEVHVTDDPKTPGPVVVSGEGQPNKTVINLPPKTRGRYVLIKNVAERKDGQWSVVELHVD